MKKINQEQCSKENLQKKTYIKIKINENWYSDSNMRNYRKKYNNLNLKQRKVIMEICEIANKKKIAYKLQ